MPKLLISDAAKYYQNRGDTAITKHFLYSGCRAGRLPHYRAGVRYIIDTDELDKYLHEMLSESINKISNDIQYGQLRRVNP